MGKKIGFVDYVGENFHANTYLGLIRGELADRGFEVAGCWALDAEAGKAWAETNDVVYAETPEALNELVDYYAILAPSNPELHLELCQAVFPFGKPTYVDKTFAPDLATAEAIFALADEHGVVMQTSSALRYTNVQDDLPSLEGDLLHMVTWGSGGSFGEYAIHPVELMVSCLGAGATRLMRRGEGDQNQLLIDFENGKTGVVNVYTNANTPFAAAVTTEKETRLIEVDGSKIFLNMAVAILDLFESGTASIARKESLTIRKILDAADTPEARNGFVKL
ncbi:MAG: Gfo/Idh/MocA family protein [Planctomycetota bacterium]|jgi:predicted dehydrogenase